MGIERAWPTDQEKFKRGREQFLFLRPVGGISIHEIILVGSLQFALSGMPHVQDIVPNKPATTLSDIFVAGL